MTTGSGCRIDVLGRELLELIVRQQSQIFIELNTFENDLREVGESMNGSSDMAALQLPRIRGSAGGIGVTRSLWTKSRRLLTLSCGEMESM